MKKIIISVMAALVALTAAAQEIKDVTIIHRGDSMVVSMKVDLSAIEVEKGAVQFIPFLVKNDSVTFRLPSIGLYSRNRFYSLAREARSDNPLQGYNYRSIQKPDTVWYNAQVRYMPWMDGASLKVDTWETGCCNRLTNHVEGEPLFEYHEPLAYTSDNVLIEDEPDVVIDIPQEEPEQVEIIPFVPHFIYVQPEAEAVVKERSISGEAQVVFRSGKTDVDPAYQDNELELNKIKATIDSVALDPDISITGITLRGFSSPDGAAKMNLQLSEQRVEAIKTYVEGLMELPEDMWRAEAMGENWEGLREAVDTSSLKNRAAILDLIDSDMDPDKKESKIKKNYSKDYKILFDEVYPLLRRTNYKVGYTVRSYSTVEEVREIMHTRPWNLSIKEFFLAADGYKPGSPEFNEVFEIAAMVFPDDPIARINAANAAMNAGDMERAARHLERVDDSPEALYTRGLYAAMQGDLETAVQHFSASLEAGYAPAGPQLDLVNTIIGQMAEAEAL